jgi:hypothetical protein
MPPRFAYWTILAGGLPTAFRAVDRDDLLPTFRRIREKHPDAQMKWFARGRLWDSPEDARAQSLRRPESRDRSWRPGGDHRDHRDARKAAAQARNQKQRRDRFERRQRTRTPVDSADVKAPVQSAKPSRPTHAPRRPDDRSRQAPPRGRGRPPHKGTGRR